MQYQVPQNITMEDKIVGPLTLIQFGILVVGGFISFFLFTSAVIPAPINQGIGSLFALFTVIVAIGRFNDQPIYRFFRFILAFVIRPRVRVWHKSGAEVLLVKAVQQNINNENTHIVKTISKADIARLAVVIDSRGNTGLSPRVQVNRVTVPNAPIKEHNTEL